MWRYFLHCSFFCATSGLLVAVISGHTKKHMLLDYRSSTKHVKQYVRLLHQFALCVYLSTTSAEEESDGVVGSGC